MIQSDYLHAALRPDTRAFIIDRAQTDLDGLDFNAIAFRGISGALVAPILAFTMKKHIIAVRKVADGTHSAAFVEGVLSFNTKYLIVDDFSSSGETVRAIRNSIFSVEPRAVCVGLYFYTCCKRLIVFGPEENALVDCVY